MTSLFGSIWRGREEEKKCGYYFTEAFVEEWAAKCEAEYPVDQELIRKLIAEDNTTPCHIYERLLKEYIEKEGVKVEPLRSGGDGDGDGDVHKQTPPPECPDSSGMCSFLILKYSESIKKFRADGLDSATKHLTETTQALSL